MSISADFDSPESLLRHSCDKYRDAAAGAVIIQCWRKDDGQQVEIEMLPDHPLAEDAVKDADYVGIMPIEDAARKAGELSMQLETYYLAS